MLDLSEDEQNLTNNTQSYPNNDDHQTTTATRGAATVVNNADRRDHRSG